MAYDTFTHTGKHLLPDGSPAQGTIEIIPSERLIIDADGNAILSGRVKVQLDSAGAYSVTLPDPNDVTLTPSGFGYTIAARLHHTHLPAVSFGGDQIVGGVLDISDVTTVDPSTFVPDANYVTDAELEAAVDAIPDPAWSDITGKPTTFVPADHEHPVSDIEATGTADATTYLRGDGTWATPASGGGGVTEAQVSRLAARNAQAAVCFTWDDNTDEHYSVVLPAINARGQRHTFFVNSGTLNTANFITSAQLAEIAASGHEIGSHAVTHVSVSSAAMTNAALRAAQYDDCKTALEAIIGTGAVTSFAYPFGAHTDVNNRELYLRYKRSAGVGSSTWANPYQRELGQRARDIVRIQWHSSDHATNMARLRAWADRPVIFVFYSHRVPEDLTVAEMNEALDLIDELGIQTLRMDEAFGSDELMNGGFEDGLTGWHMFSASAGATYAVVTDTPDAGLSGTKSLHLQTATDGDSVVISQRFPVTPGMQYVVSGRARAARTSTFNGPAVRTRGILGDGVTTSSSAGGATTTLAGATNLGLPGSGAVLTVPTTWTRFSNVVTAGVGEAWLSVELIITSGQSQVYFDHIDVRPTMWGGVG